MRRIAEKVAIIAQICITLVFVITTLLSVTNIIPWNDDNSDGVLVTMLIVMAIIYGLLSAYIIYVNFSEAENLRQILLFCDSESATHANVKVIRNIVRSCARKVDGIRVKRAKMRLDETRGLAVTLKIDVSTHNVSESIDKLRCLIADAFKNTLGLTFNSINFEIHKLKSHYKPDVDKAEKLAKTLTQQRELSADIYEQPTSPVRRIEKCLRENGDETSSDDIPEDEKTNSDPKDLEKVADIREQLRPDGEASSEKKVKDSKTDSN